MTYLTEVAADAPLDWYQMETATGTDSGSGARTVTLAGGITTGVNGNIGKGWSFDGINDQATMTTFPTITTAFTLEAWIKAPSNGGWSNDYPTVIRRDGTDIVLLRGRGSNIGGAVNPGKAEVYLAGTTMISTNRVDDGNWHHIVLTVSGTAAKLYVDGSLNTSATTSKSSYSFGTGTAYIGGDAGLSAEFYVGSMDNVAIYNTALSATRVTAHYTTGVPVSVTLDMTTVTSTIQSVEPTLDIHGTRFAPTYDTTWDRGANAAYTPAPTRVNVSTGLYDGRFEFNKAALGLASYNIASATLILRVETITGGTAGTIGPVGGTSSVYFDTSATPVGTIVSFDVTNIVNAATGTAQINLRSLTGSVDVSFSSMDTATPAWAPTLDVTYVFAPVSVTLDMSTVTSSLAAIDPTVSVGVSTTVDVTTVTSSLNGVDAIAEITNPVSIEVINTTASIQVGPSEPTIGIGTASDLDTPTLSANANDATVSTVVSPSVEVIVDTPAVVTNSYDAVASISVLVDADSQAPAQLSAHDTDVSIEFSAIAVVDSPSIEANAIRLTDVNGEAIVPSESEDRYFVSTMRTLGGARMNANASYWWRLNETSGTTVYDRASESGHEASGFYNNVTLGQFDGPDGRANVHFNGDAYIVQDEHGGQETFYQPNSLEFTFRTGRATEFIMGGQDQVAEVLATNVTSPYEVWLNDGRLEIRRLSVGFDNTIQATLSLPAGTRLDDNRWHHVVFQRAAAGSTENPGSAQFFLFEIYVDGELAMRRRNGFTPYGMPDRIGGRENDWYGAFGTTVGVLPKSNWFLGDMTEVVFRNGRTLTVDEIHAQRDAVMGILPVYADTGRVTLKATEAIVKGNKPRVLVLDFGSRNIFEERTAQFPVPNQARLTRSKMEYATTDGVWGNTVPAEFIAWGETGNQYYQSRIGSDYLVTQMSVFGPTPATFYRDAITDNFRLIDLTRDINMDDYDIISVAGYPRNETMWQTYQTIDDANAAPMIPAKVMLENLMGQIKDQVINHRMSVMITDPFSAIALGIIDTAEYVPTFKEVAFLDKRLGAQVGMIDWHAATIDPFNGAQPEIPDALQPDFHDSQKHHQNELAASRYDDTHANIRQRVRYSVDGLTTLVSRKSEWIKVDEIRWWNLNPMSTPPYETSRSYVEKGFGGLDIGDEFYMVGGDGEPLVNTSGARITERDNGWIAAPMSAVRVGHAVTSFASTWQATIPEATAASFGKDYDNTVGNPYGDHAVSIAVVPGDVWDGKIVSGKVYVNFTEAFTWWADQQNFDKIMYLTTRGYDEGNSIGIGDEISYASGARWTVTERHLKYQFSTLYGSHQDTQVQLPETRGSGPDWGWSAGGIRDSGNISGGGAQGLVWHWRSAVPLEDIYVPTMANRGLLWLSKDLDVSGNATVNLATATLTTNATEATVEVEANEYVDVSTARMTEQAFNDSLTPDGDITVLVGTADLTIKSVGLVEEITVETAAVTLDTSDPEPVAVFVDWSEAFVMVLPRPIETLILEDNN